MLYSMSNAMLKEFAAARLRCSPEPYGTLSCQQKLRAAWQGRLVTSEQQGRLLLQLRTAEL